jgi:hypothetical protein
LAQELMLDAAIVGLGWWGGELVAAAEGSSCFRFIRGVTLDPQGIREFAGQRERVIGSSYEEISFTHTVPALAAFCEPAHANGAWTDVGNYEGMAPCTHSPFAVSRRASGGDPRHN